MNGISDKMISEAGEARSLQFPFRITLLPLEFETFLDIF
jgi:hypothetical protein